ncbi:hypothetical protein Tco_0824660, partial [Tanacetum coccineum]
QPAKVEEPIPEVEVKKIKNKKKALKWLTPLPLVTEVKGLIFTPYKAGGPFLPTGTFGRGRAVYVSTSPIYWGRRWIRDQPPKAHVTPVKERYAQYKFEDDDIEDGDDNNKKVHGPHYPFKVEARIDISTYDGTVDAEKLDSWIDQFETYFTLYGFSSSDKRLKLTSHALTWWNSQLKTRGEDVSRKEFTRLLRQEFFPMGYSQDLTLGISIDTEEVLTKYVAGLPRQVQNEMRLYSASYISDASSIAMAIEQKNKTSGEKFGERSKGEGHTKEKCWKALPELFLKKWIKDDRMKRTTATTFVDDTIEPDSIEEADKSLSLMAGPQKNS